MYQYIGITIVVHMAHSPPVYVLPDEDRVARGT